MSFAGAPAYLAAALAMFAAGVRVRRDRIADKVIRSRLWFVAGALFLFAAGLAFATHINRS